MAAVFDFVFELFGRLYGEESRDTPLDFRKGNLSHYFVSTARQNVGAAFFCVNIGAVLEAGSMADLTPFSNLVFLLYTVRVEDLKPLQRR